MRVKVKDFCPLYLKVFANDKDIGMAPRPLVGVKARVYGLYDACVGLIIQHNDKSFTVFDYNNNEFELDSVQKVKDIIIQLASEGEVEWLL